MDLFSFDDSEQQVSSSATNVPCQIPDNIHQIPDPISPRILSRMIYELRVTSYEYVT